jgi:hypothetical protein
MDMQTSAVPARVLGLYDRQFWDEMSKHRALCLQKCGQCGSHRYPAGPTCQECFSPDFSWQEVSGKGEVLSWVIFHRGYMPEYAPPYNVIAVRLAEGPTMISNLTGDEPQGSWIGRKVRCIIQDIDDGSVLPRFVLA